MKKGRTFTVYEVLPIVLLTLTSGPRTRICFVASGTKLAARTGLTVTVRLPAGVVDVGIAGLTVLDAARLKSSARFATVPGVMTSGLLGGSCSVNVT